MNQAIVYRPNSRKTIWLALVCAMAIHLGAVAMSGGHTEKSTAGCISPATKIEVIEESDAQPAIDIPFPDPPNIPNADQSFHDETPPPQRQHRPRHVAPIHANSDGVRNRTESFHGIKALAISAPRPAYPYEARRSQITGSGVAILDLDQATGNVTGATMSQSTGSAILDAATLRAMRRWRFKPGIPQRVQVPITFTLTGASY